MFTQSFHIIKFTAVARNTLIGFADIQLPSGMILHDIAIHKKDGSMWASPPSKPMVDKSGQQMRDSTAKLLWTPIVAFTTKSKRDAFSAAVLAALAESHPGAFDGGAS